MPESNRTAERWAVKDKKRLLVAMMVGDAHSEREDDQFNPECIVFGRAVSRD
jgi:hypothetical protein